MTEAQPAVAIGDTFVRVGDPDESPWEVTRGHERTNLWTLTRGDSFMVATTRTRCL